MKKVYIEMPPYTEKSNGVLCVYNLFEFLNTKNDFQTIFLPRDFLNTGLKKMKIKTKFLIEFSLKNAQKNDFFIVNDTTSKYKIKLARKKGLTIVFWQLAPYSLLGKNSFPKIGDYSLPFSSCCDPKAEKFYYYQTKIDRYWRTALKYQNYFEKDSIAIYTGKGKIRKIPDKIMDLFCKENIQLITRNYPDKRNELFKILLSSKALITFDELTQLNLEAASLGIPVFSVNSLFDNFCMSKFPISKLQNLITSDPNYFKDLYLNNLHNKTTIQAKDLLEEDETTFLNIYKFIIGENKVYQVSNLDIKRYKEWTSFLKSKDFLYPHLGGQSLGILFINEFCHSLVIKNRFKFLFLRINLFQLIGKILFKLKLLRLIELILYKIRFIQILSKLNKFLEIIKIKFFEKGMEEFIFKKNRKWQKIGLDIHRFAKIYDPKFEVYEKEILKNNQGN